MTTNFVIDYRDNPIFQAIKKCADEWVARTQAKAAVTVQAAA